MGRTGYTCIRHIFCAINILIWLCACGMLGAGLWMRTRHSYEYGTLLPQYSYAASDVVVFATGCFTFIVAFFGCCGAWFQSRCLLITGRLIMVDNASGGPKANIIDIQNKTHNGYLSENADEYAQTTISILQMTPNERNANRYNTIKSIKRFSTKCFEQEFVKLW